MMAVTGAGSPHVGHGMVTAGAAGAAGAAPAVALTAAAASSAVGAVAVTLTVTDVGAVFTTFGGMAPRQL